MTATLLAHGIIRQTTPKSKRDPITKIDTGEVFGTEVAILTEVGEVMGETLRVLVFNTRPGETPPKIVEGLVVNWIVELDANRFGLNATFKREASREDIARLNAAPGTPTFFDAPPAPAHTYDVETATV